MFNNGLCKKPSRHACFRRMGDRFDWIILPISRLCTVTFIHFLNGCANHVVHGICNLDCSTSSRSQSRCISWSWRKKNHELTEKEITTYKLGLEKDLSDVTDAKDDEITHLKNEIENLKTKVEIETIRAEIYNLKILAQQK